MVRLCLVIKISVLIFLVTHRHSTALSAAGVVHPNALLTNTFIVRIKGGDTEADRVANDNGFSNLGRIYEYDDMLYHFEQHPRTNKRSVSPSSQINLHKEDNVTWVKQLKQVFRSRRDSAGADHVGVRFTDIGWPYQWYLNRGASLDMNVREAWSMGYTGEGVVITVLDDGIDYTHAELRDNYDSSAAYDVTDRDDDPLPDNSRTLHYHGTRCAGLIAAAGNNGLCIVGAAYNASIGAIRMLDGIITDAVEAISLAKYPQHIDIYTASWGPYDDGQTVEGPGLLTRRVFKMGAATGRQGLGNIYIWASGNGGSYKDSCSCDGYSNSIYTITISSASENGHIPWYSEPCSAILASTYSTGDATEKPVVTTDLYGRCTTRHSGTSASAPMAAAIVALALQANPRLTWRDVQHLIVYTSRSEPLLHADHWITTGIGKNVSHSFGFGLMDAGAMVKLALKWMPVSEQHTCEIPCVETGMVLGSSQQVSSVLYSDGCNSSGTGKRVDKLEHVIVRMTMTAGEKRGDLQCSLTSPEGTESRILFKRPFDVSKNGFHRWSFLTTHNWGENAVGNWTVTAVNDGPRNATLISWALILYGTQVEFGEEE